jgi:hypothetical protein
MIFSCFNKSGGSLELFTVICSFIVVNVNCFVLVWLYGCEGIYN